MRFATSTVGRFLSAWPGQRCYQSPHWGRTLWNTRICEEYQPIAWLPIAVRHIHAIYLAAASTTIVVYIMSAGWSILDVW